MMIADMSQDTGPDGTYVDFADLARRREALRQAAALPGADPRALLDAALAELDAAVEVLAKLAEAGAGEPDPKTPEALPAALGAERGLLRAVFQNAPAPLFLLEPDGTIRRANGKAGDLIGAPSGYATGKPLTAFIDLPSRAAVQSQLAAAIRTGMARQAECKLLGPAGPVDATLTANVIPLQDGARLLVVTVNAPPAAGSGTAVQAGPRPKNPKSPKSPKSRQSRDSEGARGEGTRGESSGGASAAHREGTSGAVQAMTRRMELVTAVTRLLLGNSTFTECVTLQRCARRLGGDIATWVIVDIERAGRLRRQFVIGPHDESSEEVARTVRAVDPQPGSMPTQVHSACKSVVVAHTEDAGALGAAPDGTPLLMLLGATSLLSVPICDGVTSYGVLTLARQAPEGRFEIADLGLAEELGEHLGVAIRVDRMFRHRSAVAQALP